MLAAAVLAALLLARTPPERIAGRAKFLARTHRLDLAERRFEGSSARADPRFFAFLELARRALPPSTRGVGLYAPGKSGAQFYLAAYTFAPLPILSAPARLPAGWIAAAYGPAQSGAEGSAGFAGFTSLRIIRSLPGGALLAPAEPGR